MLTPIAEDSNQTRLGRGYCGPQGTFRMPGKRADIIIFGVGIYEAVMNCFDFSELRVSTRGAVCGSARSRCRVD
jgi:hypothetical protein